jgi:hypothetical protein
LAYAYTPVLGLQPVNLRLLGVIKPNIAHTMKNDRFPKGAPSPHAVRTRKRPRFARGLLDLPANETLYALFACSSCLPSANSSTILAQKAGKSSGLRLVTKPWSVTTSSSTHSPPALRMSVRRVG